MLTDFQIFFSTLDSAVIMQWIDN